MVIDTSTIIMPIENPVFGEINSGININGANMNICISAAKYQVCGKHCNRLSSRTWIAWSLHQMLYIQNDESESEAKKEKTLTSPPLSYILLIYKTFLHHSVWHGTPLIISKNITGPKVT